MEGMNKNVPDAEPTRYTRHFTFSEIETALRKYLEGGGFYVPTGETYIYGLERREYSRSSTESRGSLNLVILVNEEKK